MKKLSAAEAKNGFGHLIDLARHEPVLIEKHARAVVVVLSIEEYDRLVRQDTPVARDEKDRRGVDRAGK